MKAITEKVKSVLINKYEVGDTFINGHNDYLRHTIVSIDKLKGYKVISKDSPIGAWYDEKGLDNLKKIKN